MAKCTTPILSFTLLLIGAAAAAGPTFRPDAVFKGSTLSGWTPLGQGASWRAQDGDIIGMPKQLTGGWLVLDTSFQDVAVHTTLSCSAGCKAGVLLRAEKTPDSGMKGVFVSLTEDDTISYAVTLDAQGRETSRESLADLAAAARASGAAGAAPAGAGGGSGPPQLPAGVHLPGLMGRPASTYLPGQTNAVDITLTDNTLTLRLNGGSLGGGRNPVQDAFGKYGPIALYVGGTAPATFKTLAYADLNARPFDAEKTSANFRVQRLSEFYYSYSAAIADINRDGHMDVIAGPYVYFGPDFTVGHQFYSGTTYNPTSEWPIASMVQLAHDWTGDGWPDILNIAGNAGNGVGTLHVNPRGENRRWDSYVVMNPPEGVIGNEETLLRDIDGDGKPELIHTGQNTLRYSSPDPANPTGPWKVTTISEPGPWGVNISHGMGIGDIDGDSLTDFVTAYGWWQQPPKNTPAGTLWKWHPVAFARWGASQGGAGGAEMGIYDVNGDGLNDIVTALEAHGFGLAWHEQKRGADGGITFVQHTIMDSVFDDNAGSVWFTQPHAVAFADINGDGVPDMITGKRHHSHFQYVDPDNWGMPVVYVYKVVRNPRAPGGAEFVPELVHNRSGVGSHIATGDLNKDGTIDFVTSGSSGTFVFFNQTPKESH